MKIIWACMECAWVTISNSKEHHKMDYCRCGKTALDLEDDEYLGQISWRNGWRRYKMGFETDCDWSSECMRECASFIEALMDERKK